MPMISGRREPIADLMSAANETAVARLDENERARPSQEGAAHRGHGETRPYMRRQQFQALAPTFDALFRKKRDSVERRPNASKYRRLRSPRF